MLTKIARFLFSYHITLQSATAVSSAKLMMERRLRSALDLVKPDLHKSVEQRQEHQKAACDQQALIRSIKVGDPVYTRTYRPWATWEPACMCQRSNGSSKVQSKAVE